MAEESGNNAGLLQTTGSISTGAGALSQLAGAYAGYQALKFRSQQENFQARMAKIRGEEQVNILQSNLLRDMANARASFAARGVDISSGTPEQVLSQSQQNVAKDVKKVRANADMQALQKKGASSESAFGAKLSLIGGITSGIVTGGTLLSQGADRRGTSGGSGGGGGGK